MDLRRHVLPGVALALVLVAVVFVASSGEGGPKAAPTATSTVATTSPASSGNTEEPPAPTRIVREPAEAPAVTALHTADAPKATATLLVDGNRYALTAPAGSILKEALDRLEGESSFTYAYRNYQGLGAFVTQVDGRASTGDMVWILYANGAKSPTGVSSTRIREGDTFEWKLEESY